MRLIPVILCGGAGSRLWPVSREQHPKPFIRLTDGESLLQKAILRGANLVDVDEIFIVTNREFFFKVEDEILELKKNIPVSAIVEPMSANTAAAIASSVLEISAKFGSDAMILVLAADHLISDQDSFQQAVFKAIELAKANKLVTFGITPTHPNTGYGYIETEGNRVLKFVEKPALEMAKKYLAAGNYLWNSGMFLFTAESMLNAMEKYCNDILSTMKTCITQSRPVISKTMKGLELEIKSFSLVPQDSIDYAVMEKAKEIAVVPTNIDWNDIGSWNALDKLISPDENGNCIEGDVVLHETSNCYIKSSNRMVGVLGIDNLVIVDTPDALLVADKDCAQDVKKIYNELKTKGHDAYKLHRTAHRPWGTYTVLEESENFKIKKIEVKPGASLSLQMHQHRSEHWIVVSGMAKVINGDKEFFVRVNESTFIPAGCKHRLENPGITNLIMVEVQSGNYLGEDDIIRFEDTYGRV